MPRVPKLETLRLPVIGAPLFIISTPRLVIAQCQAGIVGSMPALNARPASQLDEWLAEITETLAAYDRAHPEAPSAPFAINQIVHRSNDRLEADLALCEKYKVPLIITSLGARPELNQAVHSWGGVVLHDVIDVGFAHKAVDKGADGLVAVGSRSHNDEKTAEYLRQFAVKDYVSAGSSLKFCLVAAGEADIYARAGRTMEWDTAAGQAVLMAAGGSVTLWDGAPFMYGKPGFENPAFVARGRV